MSTKKSITIIFRVGILFLFAWSIGACGLWQPSAPTATQISTETPIATPTSSPAPTQTPTTAPTATARPTRIPDQLIFSETFEDNHHQWELGELMKIENGLMHVTTGNHELAAIKIPLESTPNNVTIQVDILPNPPTGTDTSSFIYGVGCRVDPTASDFYFLGVSAVAEETLIATYFQFREAQLVDYQWAPIPLSATQEGDSFTATFRCADDNLEVMAGKIPYLEVTNSDFREGVLFLGVYRFEDLAGAASFDNLMVSKVHSGMD